MKNFCHFRKLLFLLLLNIVVCTGLSAQVTTIPTGSFIINMGVVPQTYTNGLKPWGMVWDLVRNHRVQVKWIISQTKLKDGTDFVYDGVSYKGGTFIVMVKERDAVVNARIAYWQTQGVIGVTTTTDFTADITYNLKYSPRWTFDFQNGNIAINFLTEAGIPDAQYPKKYPVELDNCDDMFVMPHADPTWAAHGILLSWNQNNLGWIWAGCHAVSVLENLFNPGNPSQKMNFLSQNGLVPFGSHADGSPPYFYRFHQDPEMQFIGTTEVAQQNGSEQIFLPQGTSWRPTTQVAVVDPSQANVPGISPGEAGAIVYGRAFGQNNRGKVMYVGGHNVDKNNADAVAAIRNFFNFSFMSIYDKVVNFNVAGPINVFQLNSYTYRVNLPVNVNPDEYTYQWTSTCGGTFTSPTDSVTNWVAPATGICIPCQLTCSIVDTCGREWYQDHEVQVCPVSTLNANLTKFKGSKSGTDNLLEWTAASDINNDHFELEYSNNGSNYITIDNQPSPGNAPGFADYYYLHRLPEAKSAWYRLKIVDRDGKSKYSDVVAINRSESKILISPAYPNPFSQKMTVDVESALNGPMNFRLSDVSGKIVRNMTIIVQKGSNKVELTGLDYLEPGIYFLRASNSDGCSSMRLLKTYY